MILSPLHGDVARRFSGDAPSHAPTAEEEEALSDLSRVGFVQRMTEHPGWRWAGEHAAADRALLALLARFDLDLEVGQAPDETVWMAVAVQNRAGDDRTAFSGTGFAPDEAVRTCLGEFAEFQSWLYRPEDSVRRCDATTLEGRAIGPWDLLGFTPAQRDQRLAFNAAWPGYDRIPAPDTFDGEIDWTTLESLADRSRYWLPSQACFGRYGERADCADRTWRSDSNGCAAGPTRQGALAHALLELVERDATGIWWYGQARRPALPRSLLEDGPVGQALAARERMGQQMQMLDLTHDFEIPVVVAVLCDQEGNLLALGFGCSLYGGRAARSAYRELCQMELSIAFAKRRVAQGGDAAPPEDRRLLDWLARASRLPHLQPDKTKTARRLQDVASADEQTIGLVQQRLRGAGLDAYVLDLQRSDIGVPAVRAFVPGLCHYKPRFGFKRMIEVPRALGWRDARFGPEDLGALPLLI